MIVIRGINATHKKSRGSWEIVGHGSAGSFYNLVWIWGHITDEMYGFLIWQKN